MKQVMILEKADLSRLKEGQALTINFSNGSKVEMVLEGKSVRPAKAETNGHDSVVKYKHGELKKAILKTLGNGKALSATEIAAEMGVNFRRILSCLGRLNNKNEIRKNKDRTYEVK